MKSDLVYIFDFIIKQWSFTPESFRDAIVTAALAKFVLSAIWWGARFLVGKFPQNNAVSVISGVLNTKPAKFIVVILDVTLIDVFLFFAGIALIDLNREFSYFSLWSASLFSFLFVYMLIITHADVKRY